MKKILILSIILIVCFGCTGKTREEVNQGTLFVENGVIKYGNNESAEDVISLEELLNNTENATIADAKEIELSVKDGYIVWNYKGETPVHKLIAIKDLEGEQGEIGKQGATGAKGDTGATGAQGPQGEQGIQGIQGEQGLKGDKGDTGAQGPQGIQGIQGVQGEKGDQGDAGTNAYVWIRYAETDPLTTSTAISETPNNYMGVYSGSSSVAPTDASEYNWFKIKGEQGDKGETGATGAQGPQGEQGIQGEKGDQGDAGVTIDSYYKNLAIVTCPFHLGINDVQVNHKSCNLDYKGENIDVEIKDNQPELYLATIDGGTYLFEAETDFSYEVTENSANKYKAVTTINWIDNDIQEGRKNVDKDAKKTKIFIIKKKTIYSTGDLQWDIGFEGIGAANGMLTLKIHKIE